MPAEAAARHGYPAVSAFPLAVLSCAASGLIAGLHVLKAARTAFEATLEVADPMSQERILKHRMQQWLIQGAGALFVALLAGPGMAQGADYKIGFVNSERLFRDAVPAKRAQQKLEKEFAGRDAEIQKLAKQVRDLQTSLEKDGVTMAETERRNKERDLANMSRDLQRGQREFREDLNLRRNEELSAVQERANKVIQQIAMDEKFDLIIQDPVIYASQRIDITDRVIKALADK
jgi:outer membrane protein